MTLSDFFDDLFLAGKSSATGEKTLAAVEFMFLQHKGKLMRARRSLKGWRKIDPPRSRLPLPRVVACGIAAILLAKGQRKMALKVMTDFDCYLRPGEGMDILGKHVVKPLRNAGRQFQRYSLVIRDQEEGVPDKTGTFDNTLLLDNPLTKNWLGPALEKLAQTSGKTSPIFDFKPDQFRVEFQKAGETLGLNSLHTYQLRHGGASDDLNSKLRDHHAVRERGRWRTDASVRRYAKSGKIQKLLQDLQKDKLDFCKWAAHNMENMVTGKTPARIP